MLRPSHASRTRRPARSRQVADPAEKPTIRRRPLARDVKEQRDVSTPSCGRPAPGGYGSFTGGRSVTTRPDVAGSARMTTESRSSTDILGQEYAELLICCFSGAPGLTFRVTDRRSGQAKESRMTPASSTSRCAAPACRNRLPTGHRGGMIYCTPACRQRAWRHQDREEEVSYRELDSLLCDYCASAVPALHGRGRRLKRIDSRYCNTRCRAKAYRQRQQGASLRAALGITLPGQRGRSLTPPGPGS